MLGSAAYHSPDAPLRADAVDVSANVAIAGVRYAWHESAEAEVQVAKTDFSDGNDRLAVALLSSVKVLDRPHLDINLRPRIDWQRNSRVDTFYLSPRDVWGFFDRANGLLDDAVLGVCSGGVFVFCRRNSEEKHRLQAELGRTLCFRDAFSNRQLKYARHAADLATLLQLLAHEEREDEIVRGELRLADEIAHRRRMPQASRAMHQFPHLPRLSGRSQRRKLTQ